MGPETLNGLLAGQAESAVKVVEAGAGWLQYGALGLLGLVVIIVLLGGGFLVYKAFGRMADSVDRQSVSVDKLTAALALFDQHDAQRDGAIVQAINANQAAVLAGVSNIVGTTQRAITDEIRKVQDSVLAEVRRD